MKTTHTIMRFASFIPYTGVLEKWTELSLKTLSQQTRQGENKWPKKNQPDKMKTNITNKNLKIQSMTNGEKAELRWVGENVTWWPSYTDLSKGMKRYNQTSKCGSSEGHYKPKTAWKQKWRVGNWVTSYNILQSPLMWTHQAVGSHCDCTGAVETLLWCSDVLEFHS